MNRIGAVIVAVAVCVGLLGAVWWWGVGGGTGVAPLEVTALTGEVFREREGARAPGRVGMHLKGGDLVGTGPDGEVVLSRGGGDEVRIGADARVALERVEAGLVEMSLRRGQVRARVRPTAGAVRFTSRGRAVLVTDAEVGVVVDDTGGMVVEATRGQVSVSGVADHARVAAGERLYVFADGGSRTAGIPSAPLLDVAWPEPGKSPEVTLEGTTEPGARVRVASRSGEGVGRADAQGAFAVTVALEEGENRVRVTVVDAFGREHQESRPIVRDPLAPPRLGVRIQYDDP